MVICRPQAQVKAPAPEIIDTVIVPFKYHHAVTQQGNLFRTLRSFGVQVEQSSQPSKSALPARPPSDNAASARIDDTDAAEPEPEWQVVPNYQDAEEGESEWTLRARDQAGLDKAKKMIEAAVAKAEGMTTVGFLTMPSKVSFPRIVGAKGSNIARLHHETGADITVGRENNTIVIMGGSSLLFLPRCLLFYCPVLTCNTLCRF